MKEKIKNKYTIIYKVYKFIKKIIYTFKMYLKIFKRFLSFEIKPLISNLFNPKPVELQLPITYKCNFDCVMCGMKTLIKNKDFTSSELDTILNNKLFSNINSVGVNGGEPFLKKDLENYIEVICKRLPKLENIYIITNGFLTNIILDKLCTLKKICNNYNVLLNISVSVDGIGEIQNMHRGNNLSSKMTFTTIDSILADKDKYCDSINCICTITKHNIEYINEVEAWSIKKNITVNYNIATIHKRINNDYKYNDFSIFTDEHSRLLAEEFFYSKFVQTKSEKYFGIYLYIKDQKRYAPCVYRNKGVTLTPNSELLYCATFSDELGNTLEKDSYKLYFNNKKYKKNLKKQHCSGCSHYIYNLSTSGYIKYCKELLKHI